jgi:preprotein translocase subunit SecG
VTYVLMGIDVLVGLALLVLIFLHSGKDAGLSSAFGGGMSSIGGASVVQKNLDRLTVVFAIVFFACTIALGSLI